MQIFYCLGVSAHNSTLFRGQLYLHMFDLLIAIFPGCTPSSLTVSYLREWMSDSCHAVFGCLAPACQPLISEFFFCSRSLSQDALIQWCMRLPINMEKMWEQPFRLVRFVRLACQYSGKHGPDVGMVVLITFLLSFHQLIDDVLDFTSCSEQMGKPTSADLKLGLATGPVLFACQQVGFRQVLWTHCCAALQNQNPLGTANGKFR